ncbi:hypothetical protein M422DRAFT_254693 [Sphaerobolus stellatus SS14]|uniref:Uncharacterized protein n=1 Tax=Sphaerobolus stellatus (strain SS14) TaxID=990650 RepID=A0A0C9UGU4_SPHS4|nr:hypothetical protein M422DRAFT_254693 [Sphaerobolus stellatus SS14]
MVKKVADHETIATLLEGFHGRWASGTDITMHGINDYQKSLAAARHFGVREGQVSHTFRGKEYVFKFQYRDPWKWILDIVTDPTLAESIIWYPVEKLLHHNGRITRNGGGVLIGYMPVIGDPNKTAEMEDDSASSVEIAQFKRDVYQKVLHVMFRPVRRCSHPGEAVICGDELTRVLHPGFLIHSVDGEEAYCLCGTRGVKANHPCQRCLIHKSLLHNLSTPILLRYQHDMMEVYNRASSLSDYAAEKVLRDVGLHLVQNAFWKIANSDPYLAYSYDMLHAFDSGEWGKHQWPLLRETILDGAGKQKLAANMRHVPRWRSLKHFNDVTSVEFSDGNSFKEILKCIVPCLVDVLHSNSPVIHCLRFLAIIRALAGLWPVSEEYIVYLEKTCLPRYDKFCSKLSKEYGKNYDYPKHHSLVHIPFDLRAKAAVDNYTTRPGEGFQQEVQQAYDQTNFRDTEPQMVCIDENQECRKNLKCRIRPDHA